jgi:hypothetical protein
VKLKITALPEEKPIKLTVELPAAVHQDLVKYSELISHSGVPEPGDLTKLITAMVKRFMETDRAFCKLKGHRVIEGRAKP